MDFSEGDRGGGFKTTGGEVDSNYCFSLSVPAHHPICKGDEGEWSHRIKPEGVR